jgi:hypothetical protein
VSSTNNPKVAETVRDVAGEVRKAFRTAGRSYLDASEGVLESIIDYQHKVKRDVDQKWLADVIGVQAWFTRRLLELNAAQRERLGGSESAHA